jgi:NADP-dependent 3-hydroxy acid dehydrogenase YdfG
MQSVRLDDRVDIVTGATSGLGVGFAPAVTAVGASVVMAGRRTDRLDEVAIQLRGSQQWSGRKGIRVSAPCPGYFSPR